MPRPFVAPGTQTHFAPDCPISVTHMRLELTPDLQARTLRGRITLTLQSRRDDLQAVELDAVDMTFTAVTVDAVPAKATHYDGKRLRIELGRLRPRGDAFAIAIDYDCTPTRGLYFVGPDEAHPGRPRECWTQGQDEDSRFLFPVRRCASAEIHQRGAVHRARRALRSLERRSARTARARRWQHPVALRLGFPALAVPGDLGVRPLRRNQGTRQRNRRRCVLLRTQGPRGRSQAQPCRHTSAHRFFLEDHRRALPVWALQPDLRPGFHLRRHGKHLGHHAHGRGHARRARRPRPGHRVPGRARVGPPVVGRSRHLPRVARGLAQRRLRHLL
jgi:hypothetical protein